MDKNGNENCLEGIECPKCGEHDLIHIEGRSWFEVTDDGAGTSGDIEWGNDSPALCGQPECRFDGKLTDFTLIYTTRGGETE